MVLSTCCIDISFLLLLSSTKEPPHKVAFPPRVLQLMELHYQEEPNTSANEIDFEIDGLKK